MIYRSNLTCPDLTPHFKHLVSRPMGHSFGHDVPSDWGDKAEDDPVFGLYKNCGMWTHDEAAILYNVAQLVLGQWLDVGSHTGWTTAHVRAAGNHCVAVDPMYEVEEFRARADTNLRESRGKHWPNPCPSALLCGRRSADYFAHTSFDFIGIVIDGDHEPGIPLQDAIGAFNHLLPGGVIIFHDFVGRPVREGVEWLMNRGFHARVYMTPHMVGLCWRGDFIPPDHTPDPNLPDLKARCPEFPWERCK